MKNSHQAEQIIILVVAAIGTLMFSGCATMLRGPTETIVIESEPSGATVRLSNGFTGRTPADFTIARKGDLEITVTKEGFEPISILLRPTVGGMGVTTNLAGNSAVAVGTGAVLVSGVTVEGGALPAGVVASGLATPVMAVMGAVLVGGVALDLSSGAMLSHASGPLRFVLRPTAVVPPKGSPAPVAPARPLPQPVKGATHPR